MLLPFSYSLVSPRPLILSLFHFTFSFCLTWKGKKKETFSIKKRKKGNFPSRINTINVAIYFSIYVNYLFFDVEETVYLTRFT